MKLDQTRPLRLELDNGQTIELESVELEREVDGSYLRDLRARGGFVPSLAVGAQATLRAGDSVIFVGIVQEDQRIKDLLSCTDPGAEYVDF